MKKKLIFLTVILSLLYMSGCATNLPSITVWEYKVVSVDLLGTEAREIIANSPLKIDPKDLRTLRSDDYGSRASEALSKLGEQGWELLSVEANYYTFKRVRSGE